MKSLKPVLASASVALLLALPLLDASPAVAAKTGPNVKSDENAMPFSQVDNATTTTTLARVNPALANIKSKCDAAVKARVAKLEELKTLVTTSKYVMAEHRSGLLTEISTQENGLNALDSQIQNDSDIASVKVDAKKIVTNFRTYVVEVPKVRELVAIDAIGGATAKFQALSPKLEAELADKAKHGNDVAGAQSALSDLNAKVAQINSTNGRLAAPVLALNPSGFPNNKTNIHATRMTLGTEAATAKSLLTDVQTIQAALAH